MWMHTVYHHHFIWKWQKDTVLRYQQTSQGMCVVLLLFHGLWTLLLLARPGLSLSPSPLTTVGACGSFWFAVHLWRAFLWWRPADIKASQTSVCFYPQQSMCSSHQTIKHWFICALIFCFPLLKCSLCWGWIFQGPAAVCQQMSSLLKQSPCFLLVPVVLV